MIIFLYGQNSYGLIQYVNQLISRYQKKYPDSFNLHRFDLEDPEAEPSARYGAGDLSGVRNAIKGNSFFKEVKFIVIKNPFAKAPLLEKTIKENPEGKPSASYGAGAIAKEKDTVLLLYQSESGEELKNKNQRFFSLLAKEAQIKEFKPPTAQAANKFASNELAENGLSVPRRALAKLTKESGPDLWRLKNELDKIISFAREEKKKSITEEDMAKLVSFKIDRNIFDIVDAAFSNQSKAVILFENYFSAGGDPLYLLSMLAFQTKNMLIVRELIDKKYQYAQILKKTGMHPFFFKKNYEAAQKYSSEDLKKTFQRVADFEIAFKTGQAEPKNIFFKIFL